MADEKLQTAPTVYCAKFRELLRGKSAIFQKRGTKETKTRFRLVWATGAPEEIFSVNATRERSLRLLPKPVPIKATVLGRIPECFLRENRSCHRGATLPLSNRAQTRNGEQHPATLSANQMH